jgi:hypothetical protein
MENGTTSSEALERTLHHKISKLDEQFDALSSNLNEMRYRLQKSHCELLLATDPAISDMAAKEKIECEKCT